jgi:hypothetical protein
MGLEVKLEPTLELGEVVDDVVVSDALETLCPEFRDNGVGVGASNLVWKDGFSGFDEFITGGDYREHRLTAHADSRHSGARGYRYFRSA